MPQAPGLRQGGEKGVAGVPGEGEKRAPEDWQARSQYLPLSR